MLDTISKHSPTARVKLPAHKPIEYHSKLQSGTPKERAIGSITGNISMWRCRL